MRRFIDRVIYIAHFLNYLRIHWSWSSAVFCMEHEGREWPVAETEGFEPSVPKQASNTETTT